MADRQHLNTLLTDTQQPLVVPGGGTPLEAIAAEAIGAPAF